MPRKKITQTFRTSDYYIVSLLLASRVDLLGVEADPTGRTFFSFSDDNDRASILVAAHLSGKLTINSLDFVAACYTAKSHIANCRRRSLMGGAA